VELFALGQKLLSSADQSFPQRLLQKTAIAVPSKSSACVLVSACSLFAGATLSQQILVFSPDLGPAGTQTANFINDFRQSWSHHAEALVFPQLP